MKIMTGSFRIFFEFAIKALFCYSGKLLEICFITFTTIYDMTYWRNHFFHAKTIFIVYLTSSFQNELHWREHEYGLMKTILNASNIRSVRIIYLIA